MVSSSSRPRPSENVTVVIEISGGSFADGFRVRLQILEDGRTIQENNDLPNIPPAREMPTLYQDWQNISGENSRQLQAVPAQVTNVATLETWRNTTEELENFCRQWFQNWSFNSLRDRILANTRVNQDQSVPIIIRCQTENDQENEILRRIPWHTWDLFTELNNAEFAIFTGFRRQVATLTAPVRVLAIFGSSQGGLQLQEDQAALKLLEQRGARIKKISQPDEDTLSDLLFNQHWDILFFAGHSSSEGISGQIQISDGRLLPLHTLRQRLTSAVNNGLKLAIFNSCDGLRIADFLSDLNLPAVIVMREPVPDRIAYKFLLYFLQEFSNGKPLCLAVRQARDRLESLQHDFPAALWLPAVCLNPNQPELVWPARSIPQLLLFYLRSLLSYPLGLVALVGLLAVSIPIYNYRCQIFSDTCKLPDNPIPNPEKSHDGIEKFISRGEKLIANSIVKLSEPYLTLKLQGIQAFSRNEYSNAVKIFDRLREQAKKDKENQSNPALRKAALAVLKDPELLIYRNNAAAHIQNPKSPIYTIAVAAPLNDNAGLDILFGVAQAQDVAVNQNGINLQIFISSDENNPIQARKVAENLVRDQTILAVIGNYTSPNTCAALPVYSQYKLPVISPTSSVVNLRDCGDQNKVFFRTVSSTEKEAYSLVQYLIDERKQYQPKVVIFYEKNEKFSKDLFEQFKKQLRGEGGSIIAEFDNLSQPNFDISRVEQEIQNADAIALLPDGGTDDSKALENAIKIIKLNNGKKPILGANTLYLDDVTRQAKNTAADSLFLAVDWHPNQCGAAEFAQKINQKWYGDLNRRTALAYEAAQAILQAINLSGSSVNREKILQKLYETDSKPETAAASETIQGSTISFDRNGDRIEVTTRAIVSVNQEQKFYIKKDVPLKDGSCPKFPPQ